MKEINKIKNFIDKIEPEDLEQLIHDYFSIMDGVWHEGNISEPTEKEIENRNNLKGKYGSIF